MPPSAERIPLTGADAFLLAFDAETRRRNRANHLSQIVLRLAPGFDAERFAATLHALTLAHPIVRAPIRRGFGAPEYRLDLAAAAAEPRFEVHESDEAGIGEWGSMAPLPPLFAQRLNTLQPRGRAGLFHADAVRYADGSCDFALTWLHMLLDGWGSERFLELLAECGDGRRDPGAPLAGDRPDAAPDLELPATRRERGQMAMSWQRWMDEIGRRGLRSPAGPDRSQRQDLRAERVHFAEDESARIRERANARAGFLTPMIFYLAAAIRAHDAVMRQRGDVPESYVVPLPVNLRAKSAKGVDGGIFRTRVSLLWFQVASSEVGDLDALLATLKDQRRRAIASGQIANAVAALDFARFAPSRLYGSLARRRLGGELCSFFFAYTGEFCPGLEHFFGAPVRDGFGVPSVPASPGSGLVLALRAGRLGYTHVLQNDAWKPDEERLFRERLGEDLLDRAG